MAYILMTAIAFASKNLGERMCTDTLFLNRFPLTDFFLRITLGECHLSNTG